MSMGSVYIVEVVIVIIKLKFFVLFVEIAAPVLIFRLKIQGFHVFHLLCQGSGLRSRNI